MQLSLSKLIPASLMMATLTFFLAAFMLAPAVHADAKDDLCNGANLSLSGSGSSDCDPDAEATSINDVITTVVNVFTVIVGIVAVIFIIIGGFKYITSGGDSGKVGSAKNTIVYALVGLVIVALAQVLVKFVIAKST